MTVALIPAAGHSRRMGRPKLALPVGERLLIEHVVAALREGGIARVLVVLGPHVADLCEPAVNAGANVVVLPEATPDMRATTEAGLAWIETHWQPDPGGLGREQNAPVKLAPQSPPGEDWLLVPADHPTLEAGIVRALLEVRKQRPDRSILVPTWQGQRGHPTLIGWKHVAGIRAHPAGEGLNRYLRQHASETLEVEVPYPAAVEDLDTPEDYARLLNRWGSGGQACPPAAPWPA